MQIKSDNPLLLDEIYSELKRKNIQSDKITEKIDGAMGDVTTYIELAALGMQTIDVFLNYLSYRQSQKNNYVHFKLKDGMEVRLENLSQEELDEKKSKLEEYLLNDQLEFIHIG